MNNGRRKGRLSLRERYEATNRSLEFWGAMTGKPEVAEKLKVHIEPKRERASRAPGVDIDRIHHQRGALVPYERDVLAAALSALRSDPRVAFADRRQSGVFQEGNRWIRVGTRGVLDISGMLRGGRYFELEAKRPGEKPDERQRRRIEAIQAGGGISGYFTSAIEALALLP